MRVTKVTFYAEFEIKSSSEEDYDNQVEALVLDLEDRGAETVDIGDEEVVDEDFEDFTTTD